MLPPELMSLILAMPPAPPEILDAFRDEDRVHDMAHMLIDLLDLDDPCDKVAADIAGYSDHVFTLLLFHLGFIQPVPPTLGEQEESVEDDDEEAPPDRLLN